MYIVVYKFNNNEKNTVYQYNNFTPTSISETHNNCMVRREGLNCYSQYVARRK